jgi:hypothetical protein
MGPLKGLQIQIYNDDITVYNAPLRLSYLFFSELFRVSVYVEHILRTSTSQG